MRYADRLRFRRFAPALAPALLAVLALPLLAPTCQPTTPGVKTFAKGSVIIPMDACYQGTGGQAPTACPGAADAGNVLQAYGVVYQLIKNNVPVYWVIAQNKALLTDVDVTVQISSGPPVGVYNWTTGTVGGMPANNATSVINYRGGPFVVDASDFGTVQNLFQNGNAATGTPALKTLYSAVKVHVSNLAFQGYAAKTFSGGWNAGGTVAPPIALLDICGGDGIYAEAVIQGYLTASGLDFAGAGGNPTATGHGQIYDRLLASDFIPSTPGDWTTSNLGRYGYRILWAPHWEGLNSYNSTTPGCTGTARLPNQTDIDPIIKTIGGFVAAGHDLMSECASIGTLEGVFNTNGTTVNNTYFGTGSLESRFQTTGTGAWPLGGGFYINETITACAADVPPKKCFNGELYDPTFFSSPFMQVGDFVFSPVTGAIDKYRPAAAAGSTYRTGVSTLISNYAGANQVDYFSLLPAPPSAGVVVYLAGHNYNGQIAGTRLVLNTLFNLGAACVTTSAPCNTGKLGVCADGTMQCVAGVPTCVQKNQPQPEVCDGLDNDCNGAVDDIAPQQTYSYTPGAGQPPGPGCACTGTGCTVQSDNTCRGTGPCSWQCQGLCHPGISSCVFPPPGVTPPPTPGTVVPLTPVTAQQAPVTEVCNGLDDDCNGVVDNGIPPRPCYDGATGCTWNAAATPPAYSCLGTCQAGTQTCTNGSFGPCSGEILPGPEICEPPLDTNCNGIVGDGCGCVPGATRVCYTGTAGTANVGLCRTGIVTCDSTGRWPGTPADCVGQVLPTAAPACDTLDHNCNGIPDNQEICGCAGGVPQTTGTRSCYDGPAGTVNVGVCRAGTQSCSNGVWSTTCQGESLPAGVELCNGKNDTCSSTWTTDDGIGICVAGLTCLNGACVPATCGVEAFCPGGYTCNTTTSKCVAVNCPTAPCPQGQVCTGGACVDPCAAVTCGPGSFCTGGTCVGGGCLATGCTAPQVCLSGTCQANPCGTVTCPTGTFCRPSSGQPYCVQSCFFVSCTSSGQRCGTDGFCVPDPCNGVVCPAGQVCCGPGQACTVGTCVADPCTSVTCGPGQVCQGGSCIANPCTGVSCPVGQCLGGQCFSSLNPTGSGGVPWPSLPPQPTTTKSGCGCGGGAAEGLPVLLLGLLAIPLSRRRRGPRPRLGGAALLAALLALGAAGTGCGGKSETGPCAGTTCGQTCTDPRVDPANCGACGAACAAGQICVDSKCGPGSPVAPSVTGVTPGTAPTGASASVAITGQRFQSGASAVVLGAGAQTVTASFTDAGHLSATFNLATASPGASEIRVVNPDKTISNGFPFSVTAPAPAITGLNPSQAPTRAGQPPGTTLAIAVTGTGFIPSSQCHISGTNFPDQGLATTYGSATAVSCALDLSTTQPGAYTLTVANGAVPSNGSTFTVTSGTPALAGISPTGGAAGTVTSITATGSGFDSTSQVLFDGAPFGTTYFLGPGNLYAAPLDLGGKTVGAHQVTVRNGAGGTPTAAQTFTVSVAAPVLNGVSVSPSPARQGQAGALTLTGTGFSATSIIRILPPGGTAATFTPDGQTATQLVLNSYTFAAAGSYSVSVVNGTLSSGALTVTAVSNVAILAGITPANAQQGQTVTLTLTAANLGATPPTVHLAAASLGCPSAPCALDLTPTVSGNTLTLTGLSLVGWDAGTFGVTVVNPGAAPSNGLGFTVTPGQPTLTSALTAAAPQKACAVQGPTPVAIVLTGTNFAKPDATGNGGSSVHASSAALGVTDFLVPAAATTITSNTRIDVNFDTTLAVAGTYNISVWNPGPTILKSVENVTFQILASGTCP